MLARALSRTHAELLESITPEEYAMWKAYFQDDPWDDRRADLRAAFTTAVVAWVNGNKNVEIDDFMPYEPKTEAERPAEFLKKFDG